MSSGTPADDGPPLVEVDRLDVEAFESVRRGLPPLVKAIEAGSNLVPEFVALARDLFAIFYKYNVVCLPEGELTRGRVFRRRVVGWVEATPGLAETKATTRLQAVRSGLAAAAVLRQVLDLLRNRRWFDEHDLLDQWRLQRLADERGSVEEQLDVIDTLREMDSGRATDVGVDATGDALDQLEESLKEQRRQMGHELDALARRQRAELERLPARAENQVKDAVRQAAARLSEAEATADQWGSGLGLGTSGQTAADKLSLGEELLQSPKLQKLAELVGLFRQVARTARKRVLERRPNAVHSIDRGHDLSRLLTSELASLRHPLLRKEFLRRYVDELLVQYAVQAAEPSGRGPLVVCIDASGSMRGPREMWAKAIALTFLEIARRERRAFRGIVFSGDPSQARRFELLESALDRRLRPPVVDTGLVVEFADYFPGGGTDFVAPLSLAMESLRESRFRRGDIVFITDGGASLPSSFLDEIAQTKAALDFCIYAVLVDIQGGNPETIRRFADEILPVSELTAESLKGVFRAV